MGTFAEVLRYLLQSLLGVLLFAVLLRLLLQLVRADFYNPVSQLVVKVTNPLLRPLRRLIPPLGRLDSSSVVLALAIQCVTALLVFALAGYPAPNPLRLLAWGVIGVCALLVNMYFFAILAMIVLSWVAPHSHHPAIALLHQLTEPVMAPVRRLLPPLGGLDLSPILVFLAINVLEILLRGIANGIGLPAGAVIGF